MSHNEFRINFHTDSEAAKNDRKHSNCFQVLQFVKPLCFKISSIEQGLPWLRSRE